VENVKPLRVLQIELTSRCNERCVHCYIPHGEKTRSMDSALLFRIIEQCADMGVQKIVFSGGEPMLHPDFVAALEAAAARNLKIEVFSNLTLLNASIAERLKAAAASVQTSLYSMDNAIHDSVTQMPGSCEKTKQGIQTLIDHGIAVFVSCPLMTYNKDSYPGVLEFARVQGVHVAPNTFITAQSGGGRENLAYRLSVDQALDVIRSILKNDSAYNAERFLPDYAGNGSALPCVQEICAAFLCINAQGEALPSPGWHYVLGNLNTQTLRDVWEHSPELLKVRALGDLRNFPRCASCADIQFCGMSLEENANETGNPLVIPPDICRLARKTRELVHAHHRQSDKTRGVRP
jgi:MoaA/NifB/PqqE/SkfB family radical SAM enzyme